jgi:hypothetical protein
MTNQTTDDPTAVPMIARVLDNRPSALFKRDVSASIGMVFGPTLAGEYLTMAAVVPEGDGFRAYYRYATDEDYMRTAGVGRG